MSGQNRPCFQKNKKQTAKKINFYMNINAHYAFKKTIRPGNLFLRYKVAMKFTRVSLATNYRSILRRSKQQQQQQSIFDCHPSFLLAQASWHQLFQYNLF